MNRVLKRQDPEIRGYRTAEYERNVQRNEKKKLFNL